MSTQPETTDEMKADGFAWTRAVYLGRRLGRGGILCHAWAFDLEAPDNPDSQGWYKKPHAPGAPVGGVYWLAKNDEGTVKRGGDQDPHYDSRRPDAECLAWQAKDRAAAAVKRSQNAVKREARRNLIEETLAPLRDVYRQMSRQERRILVADILEAVTGQ